MEKKHFSHIHVLGQQQTIPQGHEIICSGCKLQASGLVHGCWECKFFLHDQCFTASRAMIHPSHQSHPLTLAPYPTYPSNTFFCNSCNLVGTGFAYSCSLCEFDIHVHCAYFSNAAAHESSPSYTSYQNNNHQNYVPNNYGSLPAYPPQTYNPQNSYLNQNATPYPNTNMYSHKHNSASTQSVSHNHDKMPNHNPKSGGTAETKHFTHDHVMYLSEVREKQMKLCSGCDENVTGLAYVCKNQCDFNLHKSCFDFPEEIRHNSHPNHPLRLIISPDQSNGFTCNACHKIGFSFTYNCRICKFDLHPDCASLPKTMKRKDHEHPLTLYYENGDYICDACQETSGKGDCWLYICKKCDFGTHTYCVTSTKKPVISNPQLDYYNESEEVMAALAAAKIQHDCNAFALSLW